LGGDNTSGKSEVRLVLPFFAFFLIALGGTMALFTDGTTSAIERALDGVALRQKITADNIANVATPGYRAQRVDFEKALANAVNDADGHEIKPDDVATAIVDANTAQREDGNTVNLEGETTSLVKSGLQYDALVNAINFKLGLLRTAIEGR
jgi:flagellar basal-body rod protein FlgB